MEGRPLKGGSQATAGDPWQRIAPGHRWSELVIPEPQRDSLRTTAARVSAARGEGDTQTRASGPVLLFSGPAGTGKTMAARIVAAELGTLVLEVAASALRARDRTGLEALLGRVFAAARAENAILFFDHADTILGERPARSGRHGRPGELAATDLFERAERHPAPVIFASTLSGKIDAEYRSHFWSVIEFPFPDADARERIWHQLLPEDTRLTPADVRELASSFQLPGAAIATCCAAAALTAERHGDPLGLADVAAAIEEEYRGRLASEATLAAVAALVARANKSDRKPAVTQRTRAGKASGSRPNGGSTARTPARTPTRPKRTTERKANGSGATHTAELGVARPTKRRERRLPPPEGQMSVGQRVGYTLLAAGAVLAAAGIGFLAAQLTGGAPTARAAQVAAGPIRATLPPDWRSAPRQSPRLGFTNELTLGPSGDRRVRLTIGTLPAGNPSLLPTTLLSAVQTVPPPQITTIGALSFYRYSNLVTLSNGATESVYATPTTHGTLVGVCTAPPSDGQAAGQCERILGSLRLVHGGILGAAAGFTYARALDAVLGELDAVRSVSGAQLVAAHTASAQALAASQLAAADTAAALAVNKLSAGPAAPVNAQLSAALGASAAAYSSLATAARRGNAASYATARASVAAADAGITAELTRLSALGYRIG